MQGVQLEEALGGIYENYLALGARRVGREFLLPAHVKFPGLRRLEIAARKMGILFGYADNEFLNMNGFQSCCNAADAFFSDANYFSYNILGIIKRQNHEGNIKFRLPKDAWLPKSNLFSHLNSRSRLPKKTGESQEDRWIELLRNKWNSLGERGGPASYWGLRQVRGADENGNALYSRDVSLSHLDVSSG